MKTDDERSSVQADPKNVPPDNAKRIRISFVMVVLIFTALALTAMLIWLKA